MSDYIETLVTDSNIYTSEFSKTYINVLSSLIVYYDSFTAAKNIVGFSASWYDSTTKLFTELIGQTSIYGINIALNNGISLYFYNGKKVYGNYDNFPYNFLKISLKTITYRKANGIYEIELPDLNNTYKSFIEYPITSTNYTSEFVKTFVRKRDN
jgi:hypothetical protein